MTRRSIIAMVCLAVVLSLIGCSAVQPLTTEAVAEAIGQVMQVKLEAVENHDLEAYLTTVTSSDTYYRNEQSRWLSEMCQEGMENLTLEVLDVVLQADGEAVATIHQTHSHIEDFDFTYPLLFRLEDGQWKDCGYDFEVLETPRYTIKYMEGETRVEAFNEMVGESYDNLAAVFEEHPDEGFEIKLFHDREMLRQRTIPSVTWLFTGWGEPNESLKLYTGHPQVEGYRGTVQHELVHHITIKVCNNNLSGWFLEGLAIYYGNACFDPELTRSLANLKTDALSQTIADLEDTDLYTPETQQEVWDWYNTSYCYVAYLLDTYSHETVMEILKVAGRKPFHDSVMNDDFDKLNRATTEEAILEVLGITTGTLSQDYLDWLETTDFFERF